MAFNDFTFVKTKMSDGAATVLGIDEFQPEGLETFIQEQLSLGYKVSLRMLNGGHTVSGSITGQDGTPNQGLILSAFGETVDEVSHKLQFLIDLQPVGTPNWLSIPDSIKTAEARVSAMLREYMQR